MEYFLKQPKLQKQKPLVSNLLFIFYFLKIILLGLF